MCNHTRQSILVLVMLRVLVPLGSVVPPRATVQLRTDVFCAYVECVGILKEPEKREKCSQPVLMRNAGSPRKM